MKVTKTAAPHVGEGLSRFEVEMTAVEINPLVNRFLTLANKMQDDGSNITLVLAALLVAAGAALQTRGVLLPVEELKAIDVLLPLVQGYERMGESIRGQLS